MPVAIAQGVATAVGFFTSSVGVPATLALKVAVAAYHVAHAAAWAAISWGVNEATRQRPGGKLQGGDLTLQIDADYPRQFVIGRTGIAGSLAAHYSTGGSQNYNLHLVYPLADHPVTSCEQVFADSKLVRNTPLSHGVRTEITAYSNSGGARVWMTFWDGRPGQTADTNLIAASALDPRVVAGQLGAWTSAHVGAGVAWMHVELQMDSDILTSVPSFLFDLKGAPLYDRRLDSTAGGSGSHRHDDPETWEWTDNAAVALDHYMLGYQVEDETIAFGVGLRPEEVPYADFAHAADLADEDIETGVGDAIETIKRFRADGAVGADEFFEDVIEGLQMQLVARIVDLGGRVGFLGAEERSSVISLSDADLVAEDAVGFADRQQFVDLIGAVEGRYSDPSNLWQPTDYERQATADAVFADGGEAQTRTMELRFENHPRRAVRNVSAWLAREQRQARLSGAFMPRAYLLEPGDVFNYTSDFLQLSAEPFEVIDIIRHADMTVSLTARAINPDFLAFDNDNDPDLLPPPEFDPVDNRLAIPTFEIEAEEIAGAGSIEPALAVTLLTADPLAREAVIEIRRWSDGTPIDLEGEAEGDDPDPDGWRGGSIVFTGHVEQETWLLRAGILPKSFYRARMKVRSGRRESRWTLWSDRVETTHNYVVPTAGEAGAGSALQDAIDRLASSFVPFAWVGALGDVEITANTGAAASITVSAGSFDHPELGTIEIDETYFATPWGVMFAPVGGRFIVVWSEEAPGDGLGYACGDGYVFPAVREEGVWKVYANDRNAGVTYTPQTTDVVMAQAFKPLSEDAEDAELGLASADGVTHVDDFIRLTLALNTRASTLEAKVGDASDTANAAGTLYARVTHQVAALATEAATRASQNATLLAAINTPVTGILARITSAEEVIADLDDNFASATDFDELYAEINEAGTGVLARLVEIDEVIADLDDNYASASSFDELTAEIHDEDTGVLARLTDIDLVVANLDDNYAAAADFDELYAEVMVGDDSIAAKVTSMFEATASPDGSTALVAFEADADGVVTGFKLISHNGHSDPISKIQLTADTTEIDGDVMVDGTLTATKVVAGGLGSRKYAIPTAGALDSSGVTVASLTVDVEADDVVEIFFSGRFTRTSGKDPQFAGGDSFGTARVRAKIKRGSTDLLPSNTDLAEWRFTSGYVLQSDTRRQSSVGAVDSPGAGTFTYSLVLDCTTSTSSGGFAELMDGGQFFRVEVTREGPFEVEAP